MPTIDGIYREPGHCHERPSCEMIESDTPYWNRPDPGWDGPSRLYVSDLEAEQDIADHEYEQTRAAVDALRAMTVEERRGIAAIEVPRWMF